MLWKTIDIQAEKSQTEEVAEKLFNMGKHYQKCKCGFGSTINSIPLSGRDFDGFDSLLCSRLFTGLLSA